MVPFLLLACVAQTKDADSTPAAETDADTDADTDTDLDCSGPATGTDPELPAETPSFTVDVGTPWAAETGYWVALDGVSTVKGNREIDDTTQELVILTVAGDVGVAGRYRVDRLEWVRQLSQSGDVFHYGVTDPPDLCLVVDGHAEDALFAHTEGEADLLDPAGGYPAAVARDFVARSWPAY